MSTSLPIDHGLSLPSEWQEMTLVSTAQPGGFVDGDWVESPYITDEGIRLVQTGNIGIGEFIDRPDNQKFVSHKTFSQLNCKWVYPGDILICRLADPIGRACRIPDEIGPCITAVDCTIYRPQPDAIVPSFALQILNWGPNLKRLSDLAGGSTRQRISRSNLGNVIFRLPHLAEQRRIAEILDTADEAIRRTEQVVAKLRAVKVGLLHDLLTCGLDERGHLRDPQAHPEQFMDSPLGRIPKKWKSISIGSLAVHVGSGATPLGGSKVYQKQGIVFIRSQNVTFDGLLMADVVYIDSTTHEAMKRSEIFEHDVLLNITGASIGRCCPVPDWIGRANVNQHVCAIRLPKPKREDAIFLSSVLSSAIGQSQIDRLNAGSNRQGLNYDQLRSFIIPWPRQDERIRLAGALETHDIRIRAEEAELAKLRQVKRGLMDDLLTGEVRTV